MISNTKRKKLERAARDAARADEHQFIENYCTHGGHCLGKSQTRGRFRAAAKHARQTDQFQGATWLRSGCR